ncbi:MAG: hypothetical protein HYV75_01615 [Opitutae bacterium]|nr:hypothetical protein [Opitutae bacterium]
MAWRIEVSVIRGELDNRVRGHVTGRIWFAGSAKPMELTLTGNCWRDLAGRRLEFTNPDPKPGDLGRFALVQKGAAGDITASRKVKVPDIPLDQIGEYYAAKKPFPWHWGNSLYLEWFSETNGRVVIESASYDLKIVGEPAWEMTPEEEEEQRRANGEAMTGFVEELDAAMARSAAHKAKPLTEEEAEALQVRSDLLLDRIDEQMAKEDPDKDSDEKLRLLEAVAWLRRKHGQPKATPVQLARNDVWIEEMRALWEISWDGVTDPDPAREMKAEFAHPLYVRANDFSSRLWQTAKAEGWIPKKACSRHPAVKLSGATIRAMTMLGMLAYVTWPPPVDWCACIIVRLKRARGLLDEALRAAGSCQEEKLISPEHLGPIVVELADLVHDTDEIIAELRKRLERGTD